MVVSVRQYLNLDIYVSNPGDSDEYGDTDYGEPQLVKACWADAMHKHTYHQRTESNDQSEVITLKPIHQRARVWPPGADPKSEDEYVEPDHTFEVYDPNTGKVLYYVTRL